MNNLSYNEYIFFSSRNLFYFHFFAMKLVACWFHYVYLFILSWNLIYHDIFFIKLVARWFLFRETCRLRILFLKPVASWFFCVKLNLSWYSFRETYLMLFFSSWNMRYADFCFWNSLYMDYFFEKCNVSWFMASRNFLYV